MIICKHCGREISEKHIICPYCAKKQTDKEKNKKNKVIKEFNIENPEVIVEEVENLNKEEVINEKNNEALKEIIKGRSFKLEYILYALAFISIACLFFPIVEFNYYPKENSLFDYKYFLDNNIDLIHKLNIFRLIFGLKVGNGDNTYDTILFNPINFLLIILPILVCIFKNRKFSISFIILDMVILICTRFLFLKKGMIGLKQGFGYEIIYSFGFFINFSVLVIFLIFDFYYLFGSEKNGRNL